MLTLLKQLPSITTLSCIKEKKKIKTITTLSCVLKHLFLSFYLLLMCLTHSNIQSTRLEKMKNDSTLLFFYSNFFHNILSVNQQEVYPDVLK